MSITAINGVSQASAQTGQTPATAPSPTVTPFSKQLDAYRAEAGAAHDHGHHHHHGSASGSVTSSTAAAASAAGGATAGTVASSLLTLRA